MIARTWRGATRTADAAAYLEYLRATGLSAYAATPGNRAVLGLSRELAGPADAVTEFLLVSFWDSMGDIRRFSGPDPERAVFYPEDDRFLVSRDLHTSHYQLIHSTGALTR
ncbi:MAG: hypothetical protein AB7L66_10220 [Gemmatimonadales bacterium]